ncbi:MAG TPA: two-component regulator propeller domain-containing protein, partial [Rhodothermales bacterium]
MVFRGPRAKRAFPLLRAALLSVAGLLLLVPSARGQRLSFEHLTGSDGLSHAHVQAIVQDHLGFMWIGTYGGGLNRYDGYGFVVYEHDPADLTTLPNNNIHTIYEDREGTLWVGTWVGMSRYDRERDLFQNWTATDTSSGVLGAGASGFAEDDEGNLWIATTRGLNKYDRNTGRFEQWVHDPADPRSIAGTRVRDIVIDDRGRSWIGTSNGLSMHLAGASGFVNFRHDPAEPRSLPHDEVMELEIDRHGFLWIATWGGGVARLDLNAIERGFDRFQHDPNDAGSLSIDRVLSLLQDRSGRMWVGTENGGLDRFDYETGTFIHTRANPDDSGSLSHD